MATLCIISCSFESSTTFVSKYAAEYFVNAGYEVYVLNRNTKPQVHGVNLIEGDRHNLNGIEIYMARILLL